MSEQEPNFWSNAQTYGMAIICMVLGVAAGYLLHAPSVASPSIPAAEVSAPPPKAAPQMPSAADMKRMAAAKKVAPLLEQLQKNPNDSDLMAKVAKAYMASTAVFRAPSNIYEKSIAAKPQAETLNELAFVYVKLGDLDRGIEALNKAHPNRSKEPAGAVQPWVL